MKEKNRLFDSAGKKAASVLKDPEKTKKLLDTAFRRSSSANHTSPFFSISKKIQAAIRMMRAYIQKEYTDIPWQSIIALTAALIYFVWPLDAIADFIPLMGFADDAAILSAVLASINQDLERFLSWENSVAKAADEARPDVIDAVFEEIKKEGKSS
ncbi:YkvA family protein [Chlorobium sp.]|uniref:YkvA family protein n=1 Tax=Chlorobium sp. TaxID=1095 RepID=UPI002F425898